VATAARQGISRELECHCAVLILHGDSYNTCPAILNGLGGLPASRVGFAAEDRSEFHRKHSFQNPLAEGTGTGCERTKKCRLSKEKRR
jgi:hypothetical protein